MALRTPEDIAAERNDAALTAFGFRAKVEAQDVAPLVAAVEAARRGQMPMREDRFEGLCVARKYGTAREVARVAAGWLDSGSDPPPGELLIALVWALRATGRIDEALAHTDILVSQGNGLTQRQRQILLTERGALWLDRCELTHDPGCLERAERCVGQSWAIGSVIGGQEECSALYRRLRKLQDQVR